MSSYILWGAYSYLLLPMAGFFIFSFLALFSISRARKNSANMYFAYMCLLGCLIDLDITLVSLLPDESLALRIDRLTYLFFVFVIPVYIRFVHSFLGIKNRRWIEIGAYIFSIALLPFTQTDFFITGLRQFSFGKMAAAGPFYYLFSVIGGIASIYCISTLFIGLKGARSNSDKNRIKYVLIGFGLTGFLIMLNTLPISGYDVYPMGNLNFIPAIILAFAVLRYDLLDIGILIRKGSIYFILTGILTFIYALAIYLSNILFIGYGKAHPVILPLASAIIVVVLFNPAHAKIQKFVDRTFFRGRYDYQDTLRQMSGAMASLLKVEEIVNFLLQSIPSAMKTVGIGVAIYEEGIGALELYSSTEGKIKRQKIQAANSLAVAAFFERYRETLVRSTAGKNIAAADQDGKIASLFEESGAAILIPMIYRGRLKGIMALGEKRSGELFVHEDMELLSTIASQGAIAIENANSYEKVEEMNIRLEEKVKKRTEDLAAALEEKERTQQQLVRSESLASIGQLVAGTAHELNNPLASSSSLIQICSEIIGNWKILDDAERDEVIGDLNFSLKELDRASAIVKSLLDLSRQTQTYVEPVDINIVIDDALRVLRNRYKNTEIAINKDMKENIPQVEGNFANLGQVFINIISNAIQAHQESRGLINLVTVYDEDKDAVVVECRDRGKGMSPEEIRDAFKPFFTTKKPGEGTGLGLYIAHEIIRKHDGYISIDSEKGKGTTVSVELPCRRVEK